MKTFTEQLLDALPPPGDPVTTEELAKTTGEANTRVTRSIDVLRRRKLVERLEPGRYRLTDAGQKMRADNARITSGPQKPHSGRKRQPAPFREALWKALRMGEAMTVPDLLTMIPPRVHGNHPNSNAYNYLRRLVAAGYAIELTRREAGTAVTSNGFKRFRLIKNTGPLAPYWSLKEARLIDLNPQEVDHE